MGKILALLLMALGLVKGGLDYEEGQCGLAENCCVGRDSSCVVHGLQTNGKIVRDACYCDEGCLDTGDCCSDYEAICNAERKFSDCHFSSESVALAFSFNAFLRGVVHNEACPLNVKGQKYGLTGGLL